MMTLPIAQSYHRQGKLDKAEKYYLDLLETMPHNATLLHSLGLLYAEKKEFDQAVEYFQRTIDHATDSATLYTHLGNAQQASGLFKNACDSFKRALALDPNNAQAMNNLGVAYYRLGQFDNAISQYQAAIHENKNYAEAHYNLALAFQKKENNSSAMLHHQSTLSLLPTHPGALFNLAHLHMQSQQFDEAVDYFSKLLKNYPEHTESLMNSAICYLRKGELNHAKKNYEQCVALPITNEDSLICFYNLGFIHSQQGDTDAGIRYYQQVIVIDPTNFEAHNNIGVAFLGKKEFGLALKHFKEALRIQPTNKAIAHTIDILSQKKEIDATPIDYIRNLFDYYADHYDTHLITALDYQLPTIIHEKFTQFIAVPEKKWDIVDLGCGTGLVGQLFKSSSRKLIGVDLSSHMLAVAKQKEIYDDLICADIMDYLSDQHSQYDLLIAADVLVYVGKCDAIFKLCAQALKPNGYFIFNVEVSHQEGYDIQQSGRFAHHATYIHHLAKINHFNIHTFSGVITRMQNNEPVPGYFYILTRV